MLHKAMAKVLEAKGAGVIVRIPLSAALVGTGFIGPVHVEAPAPARACRCVGVLGSSPSAAASAARPGSDISRAYDTFDELLADPTVDVVHLASPNRLHFEQCKPALAAGKHVVCEKPLAMTQRRDGRAGRAGGGVAAVVRRCATTSATTRCASRPAQRIAAGAARRDLPRHRLVRAGLAAVRRPTSTGASWPSEGGALRAVADIGTHWLDLVQFDHRAGGRRRLRRPADGPTRRASGRQGSVETFSAKLVRAGDGAGRRSTRRITAPCCCGSTAAQPAASRCRR